MPSRFILKLQHGADLTDADRGALEQATRDIRRFGPREDLISEGDRPDDVHVILEGVACRYKLLPDGGRQITAYLMPGDMCDLHVFILGEMDHAIGTLTSCRVAYLSRAVIEELTTRSPAVTRALWWATLVDEGVLREWIVGMGRRPADRQMAHLLCELLLRLQAVELADASSFDLPMTQAELGDALGLSEVHVNRVLQQLRAGGLIRLQGRRLIMDDLGRLQEFAEFDPAYLHLRRRREEIAGAGWAERPGGLLGARQP